MRSSNIGGQAVLEGIMMKNGSRYAVAVRKPDQEIEVDVQEYRGVISDCPLRKIPFLRGIFGFIDSLVLGMKTLMFSASFFADEQEEQETLTDKEREKRDRREKNMMNLTVTVTTVAGVVFFMLVPYFLSNILKTFTTSRIVLAAMEGFIRVGIFLGYIALISMVKDIQRTFMYHGAEHKCINCIEQGLTLNVGNVRKSSKQHKRCGTSFLFFVMAVSILFCFFIITDSPVLRVVLRIVLLPLIAGVSYELIKLAGSSDSGFVNFLSRPGMWIQNLTTKEPDDEMIQVAICAVEAVFDWQNYQAENFGSKLRPEACSDPKRPGI